MLKILYKRRGIYLIILGLLITTLLYQNLKSQQLFFPTEPQKANELFSWQLPLIPATVHCLTCFRLTTFACFIVLWALICLCTLFTSCKRNYQPYSMPVLLSGAKRCISLRRVFDTQLQFVLFFRKH